METAGCLIDPAGHPAVLLAGRSAQATVYLPDPGAGYYRGPRFDWSGMMASLRLDGHEVFGEWKDGPRDPLGNDFAVGPAGEFGMGPDTDNPAPIGWDDAPVGGTFLKIGAGERRKTDDGPYHFGHAYPLVSAPRWRVRWAAAWMECREEASTAAGWGYRFTKRIEIDATGPAMTIRHSLVNTGTRSFRQTWYCHNFVRIDGQPIGTGYGLEFPFAPRLARSVGEAVEVRGNTVRYIRELGASEGMFAVVEGYGRDRAHNAVTISGPGAALRIAGDTPVHKLHVFATGRTVCPELFVCLDLAPAASRTWTDRYALVP